MRKRLLVVAGLYVGLLFSNPLHAEKFWEKEPFIDWTLEEAQELLQPYKPVYLSKRAEELGNFTWTRSSPWVYGDKTQVDAKRSSTGFSYIITWYARPVCEAIARTQQLRENLSDEATVELASSLDDESTITISIDFRNEAHRDAAGNRLYNPSLVDFEKECWLEKKDGGKIMPAEVQLPEQEEILDRARVMVVFSKTVDLKPVFTKKDNDVYFRFAIEGKEVKEKFKLKDFIVNEKLEL